MIRAVFFAAVFATAMLSASGCATKIVFAKDPTAPVMPALSGKVCISDQPLPYDIPAARVGQVHVRKRSDTPGDTLDAIAGQMRLAGANYIQIMAAHQSAGWGHASFIDPKLKLNCAAAGGQLR